MVSSDTANGAAAPRFDMGQASRALDAFVQGPVRQSADAIEEAFAGASRNIANELAKATAQGELSFRRLSVAALSELSRIAIEQLMPGGARQGTNPPVSRNTNALGDMLGVTTRRGGNAVTINMLINGTDAEQFTRSKGQISQTLARVVSDGLRRL